MYNHQSSQPVLFREYGWGVFGATPVSGTRWLWSRQITSRSQFAITAGWSSAIQRLTNQTNKSSRGGNTAPRILTTVQYCGIITTGRGAVLRAQWLTSC